MYVQLLHIEEFFTGIICCCLQDHLFFEIDYLSQVGYLHG
jgi:hypothetical protein